MTTRRWMLLGWMVALLSLVAGIVAFLLWQVLMAVMVVYVMVR